ncbi:MAG: DNA translocase FtsK 4TM domain-containing protein [Planctomycetota bacterium]
MRTECRREIVAFSVLGLSAFLWVCLLTHRPEDYLGPLGQVENACGRVGAFVAFQTTLWLGTLGAYAFAAALGLFGILLFFRVPVPEPGWKLLGLSIFLLTLASIEVAFRDTLRTSRVLPGGFYGQFFYRFLLGEVSAFGTYLILGFALLVSFVLSTDTVLSPLFARAGAAAASRERWRRGLASIGSRVPEKLREIRIPRPRLVWEWRKPKGAPGRTDLPEEPAEAGEGSSQGAASSPQAPPSPAPAPQEAPPKPRPPLKIHEPVSEVAPKRRPPRRVPSGPYELPTIEILDPAAPSVNSLDRTILEQTAAKIEETLRHFKIEARVVEVQKGPTITQYELALAAGIKVHKIMNLSDDLAMALKAPSIRIVAPIPGKSTVGVEVPNKTRSLVRLRELFEAPEFREEEYQLPLALGKDVAGAPVISDLGDMPHLLIAGSTGSGKSICINSIITTLLLTRTPEEVKLILVDPKMVELAQFENIPHLLAPVVTDMKKAPAILGWTVDKMEERYELFAMVGVRHITSYNSLGREKLRERLKDKVDEEDLEDFPERLPWIVVIIDELADLMLTSSKEVETSITRLSQKSRAVGIHVILATQRPSVDVITGLIKANMPSRISFHVASKVDSRTILDRNGAEKLLGKGDMLYLPPGTSALLRVQGTYISDREIRDVVDACVRQAEPQFSPELTRFGVDGEDAGSEEDELYEEAVRIVLSSRRGSVTLLQRQLQIGYTRASRLMELMHEQGLVGPFKGSKAREVYYTIEEWEEARKRRQASAARDPDGEDPGGRAGGADPEEADGNSGEPAWQPDEYTP